MKAEALFQSVLVVDKNENKNSTNIGSKDRVNQKVGTSKVATDKVVERNDQVKLRTSSMQQKGTRMNISSIDSNSR